MLTLVVGLAVAMPITVMAWLVGAHVTPEQSLRHSHAMAQHGMHRHALSTADQVHDHGGMAHRHTAPVAHSDDAGARLSAASTNASLGGLWQAVTVSLVLPVVLSAHRLQGRAQVRCPACFRPDVLSPPPRSRALGQV